MHRMTCPACFAQDVTAFHEQSSVPSNSCILLETPGAAKSYPHGRIVLGFCDSCGFIYNSAFDPKLTEYSGRYEETQAYSGTFNEFHHALAERLIDDYGLKHKRILEIGCGKGEFLKMICEMGQNEGIGFDPGFRPERLAPSVRERIEFVQDFYTEEYAHESADLICCKMTLEHISGVGEFIGSVRQAIGDDDSYIFFQIPEAVRIFRDCAFEDIYYEHCSYFSPGALARLFRRNGFEVLKLATEYDDQYLTIEARPARTGSRPDTLEVENDLDELRNLVSTFPARAQRKLEKWRGVLDDARVRGQSVALWGSGSKAVSFLTSLGVTTEVDCVVDINPHRCGHYMAGTGHPIVAPEQLAERVPDVVIVMNAIYNDEIVAQLDRMGVKASVLTL